MGGGKFVHGGLHAADDRGEPFVGSSLESSARGRGADRLDGRRVDSMSFCDRNGHGLLISFASEVSRVHSTGQCQRRLCSDVCNGDVRDLFGDRVAPMAKPKQLDRRDTVRQTRHELARGVGSRNRCVCTQPWLWLDLS